MFVVFPKNGFKMMSSPDVSDLTENVSDAFNFIEADEFSKPEVRNKLKELYPQTFERGLFQHAFNTFNFFKSLNKNSIDDYTVDEYVDYVKSRILGNDVPIHSEEFIYDLASIFLKKFKPFLIDYMNKSKFELIDVNNYNKVMKYKNEVMIYAEDYVMVNTDYFIRLPYFLPKFKDSEDFFMAILKDIFDT